MYRLVPGVLLVVGCSKAPTQPVLDGWLGNLDSEALAFDASEMSCTLA